MSNAKANLAELEQRLADATAALTDVTGKKMFGCHALWAKGNVFALVWKHGRLGVKLPDEKSYEELMKIKGAEPWKAGPMKMAHWVLVPESFHEDPAPLKKWAKRAYEQCKALPPKAAPKKGKKK